MLLPLLCLCTAGMPDALTIQIDRETGIARISLRVASNVAAAENSLKFETASQWLKLSVVKADGQTGPPVFARYTRSATHLILRPRYPLLSRVNYVVEGRSGNRTLVRQVTIPVPKAARPPRVTQVFPSSRTIPANCLKFYIHFSRPMREGRDIFDRIQIRDAEGKTVSDPWRRTELWNQDATRLTLWIHPGRIKQGVNLRNELGPVLRPGREYQLVIMQTVCGADGVPLERPAVKRFRTTCEDHSQPDPSRWKLHVPHIRTREPLQVRFEKPLDRALLLRMLRIQSGDREIPGTIRISAGETRWSFTPLSAWSSQNLTLRISRDLEDQAGNTPDRPFDRDLTSPTAVRPRLALPIRLRTGQPVSECRLPGHRLQDPDDRTGSGFGFERCGGDT